MKGWIINLWDSSRTAEVERDQVPVIIDEDGVPVFEIWFWHGGIGRWFVMTLVPNEQLARAGVVFFRDQAELERKVLALGGEVN